MRGLLEKEWVQWLLGLKKLVLEDGTDLDLTWTNLPPAWVVFILILPAIVVGAILVYRYERRDAGPFPKIVMGFCRAMLVLLVVTMLFGPTITVEAMKEKKAYLLVLVDDSLSMAKQDRPRLPEHQQMIARAIYEHVPETLEPGQIEQIRSLSRFEVVQRALKNPRMAFLETLEAKMNVAVYSFNSKAVPRDAEELQTLAAAGPETAIGEAINQALAEKRGQTVLGVIVLTDGRNNAGQDPLAVAENLHGRYVSVYMVAPGVQSKPMDLKLLDLEAPEAAIANDHVRVKYRIESEGYPGETIKTRIYLHALMEGQEVAGTYKEARSRTEGAHEDEKIVTLEGEEFKRHEEFIITPRTPGLYELIVITDVLEGEQTEENNFLAQRFLVADEKITVLYVDHWPRWEYRFLKNALIRDPKIKAYILLTSADPTFPQDCSPGLEPIKTFPDTLKDLLAYDVVIVGDVPLGQIGGPKAAENLATFCSEFGGGVVFISGTDSNPRGYRETPLEKVLPIVIEDPGVGAFNPYERDLPYRLTREGEEHEIPDIPEGVSRDEKRRVWNNDGDGSLPRIRYYTKVKRIKSNAQTLVELMDPAAETPPPLFVTMFYGQGRVFFGATDETYRWRWLRGDAPYFYPFWRNVMYWARKGKLLGLHRFRVSVDKDKYSVGETVHIKVLAYDQNMEPLTAQGTPQIEVYVEPPDGDRIVLLLPANDAERDGLYEGTFVPSQVGEFRIWAGDESDLSRDVVRFSVYIPNREEEEPIIDEARMRQVAAASYVSENERDRKGSENFYTVDQLDELTQSIRRMDIQLKETREDDLWDAPLVYLLFALLITVEWIMRKIYRML